MRLCAFVIVLAFGLLAPLGAQPLEEQCLSVGEAITAWRAEKKPGSVKLVLGARSHQDRDRIQASSRFGLWIYADFREHQDRSVPHLQLDFNDPDHLEVVSTILEGQVDIIQFDRATAKFLDWDVRHLKAIRNLLSPRGTFFLPARTAYVHSAVSPGIPFLFP